MGITVGKHTIFSAGRGAFRAYGIGITRFALTAINFVAIRIFLLAIQEVTEYHMSAYGSVDAKLLSEIVVATGDVGGIVKPIMGHP